MKTIKLKTGIQVKHTPTKGIIKITVI